MKAVPLLLRVFSAAFLVQTAMVVSAQAAGTVPAAPRLHPMMTSNEFIVTGEVLARNEAGFTLLSRGSELTTVQINRHTQIKKGAETIRLADVMVGDKVSVTLMRGAGGSLQAVNVAVRTGFEPRS